MPDVTTPVEVTLEACGKFHEQGKFKILGLSNYAAWETAKIVYLCKENSWPRPTVYQGMYNALTRQVDAELFPCIREYGLSFYAYNPLSAGLLSGRYQNIEEMPEEGRFAIMGNYRDRYWQKEYFDSTSIISMACENAGISMVSAAFSWMVNHSEMKGECDDRVILGVSKFEHLEQNLGHMAAAKLPQSTVDEFDRAWEPIKGICPKYFRP
jgi:aflatoxin B1 aldehyde reductase